MTFFQNPEKNIIFIETFINQKSPPVKGKKKQRQKSYEETFLLK